MLNQVVVTLLSFLVIASAFDATLGVSMFSLNEINLFSYELFQTPKGIIAHGYNQDGGEIYVLIDLSTKNTPTILSDIVSDCTKGTPSNFDRLHYHVATSTLVYYCLSNNSLLVIDQEDFTVQDTIPANVSTAFDEVRLVPQGYSIAILGLSGLWTQSSAPSEIITINLQSQTVSNHIVFNHGLNTGETVMAYAASTKNSLYILTTQADASDSDDFEKTSQVTLYSMTLIGSAYSLTNLNSFNASTTTGLSIVNNLYCSGDLVIVSYAQDLAILSSQGNILGTVQGLGYKEYINTTNVALAVQYGSSDFYALLENSTMLKFTASNAGYSFESIDSEIIDMQYANSNSTSGSLLFTIDVYDAFYITDLQNSQFVYASVIGATDFIVTDTIYAGIVSASDTSYLLYIFNRETDLLISKPLINSYYYFYDENSHIISYMDYTDEHKNQCRMVQIDVETGNKSFPFVLNASYGNDCQNYYFTNVTNDLGTPQFTLILYDFTEVVILSEKFGAVHFKGEMPNNSDYLPFVDYDTLTVYAADSIPGANSVVTLTVYDFDSSDRTFNKQNQLEFPDIYTIDFDAAPGQPGQLVISALYQFAIIDLNTMKSTTVDSNFTEVQGPSFLQDKSGNNCMIFGFNNNYSAYYQDEVSTLPGITQATYLSIAAGQCYYAVVDQVNYITQVRFYNICSENDSSEIMRISK